MSAARGGRERGRHQQRSREGACETIAFIAFLPVCRLVRGRLVLQFCILGLAPCFEVLDSAQAPGEFAADRAAYRLNTNSIDAVEVFLSSGDSR